MKPLFVKYYKGLIISVMLIAIPFLFYFYRYVPSDIEVWQTKYLTISAGGFNTVQGFMHQFVSKTLMFIILSIWYLTCKHWWRWAILVPLTLFLFQLSGVVNQNVEYIDHYDFYTSLPIVLPIIAVHIYVAEKYNKLTKAATLKSELDNILKSLKDDD